MPELGSFMEVIDEMRDFLANAGRSVMSDAPLVVVPQDALKRWIEHLNDVEFEAAHGTMAANRG